MERIKKTIDVDCPISKVYNQWTQFEEFPQFMGGVKEVRQLDDKRLHWKASIAGKEKEWTAKIVEQIPDNRIAWKSESGEYTSGQVDFARLGNDRTQVSLELSYDPSGFVESTGDALGLVSRRVKNDLERCKELIERRGNETGAWRGTIREGHTA